MSSVLSQKWPVKWSMEIIRRGRVRYKRTVKVACHREVQLEGGGTDLVRCGTAMVQIVGWRPQYIGVVRKRIGPQTHTYHVTQPYIDKDACRQACRNSIAAGEAMERAWAEADEETRTRWHHAAMGWR